MGLSRPMVVDAGAGSGSLLRPLLSVLGDNAEPWAVEVSPPAREALAELVGARRVVSDLDKLPRAIRGAIFANELLDNLPMALARRRGGEWRELWVGRRGWRVGMGGGAGPSGGGGVAEQVLGSHPGGGNGGVPTSGGPVDHGGSGPIGGRSVGGHRLRRYGRGVGKPPCGGDAPHLSGPSSRSSSAGRAGRDRHHRRSELQCDDGGCPRSRAHPFRCIARTISWKTSASGSEWRDSADKKASMPGWEMSCGAFKYALSAPAPRRCCTPEGWETSEC